MHDSTEGGRKIRLLNIVDDYTREALWMEVSTSITGAYVTKCSINSSSFEVNFIACHRQRISPEFAGAALDAWTYANKSNISSSSQAFPIRTICRSFNGKVRDECLNEHWWRNIDHAREAIELANGL